MFRSLYLNVMWVCCRQMLLHFVSYSEACCSLTPVSRKAMCECMNAVCITRTVAYAFWLFGDLSDRCEDMSLDDGSNIFRPNPIFITLFYMKRASQECGYRDVAELTVFLVPPPPPQIQAAVHLVEALCYKPEGRRLDSRCVTGISH